MIPILVPIIPRIYEEGLLVWVITPFPVPLLRGKHRCRGGLDFQQPGPAGIGGTHLVGISLSQAGGDQTTVMIPDQEKLQELRDY